MNKKKRGWIRSVTFALLSTLILFAILEFGTRICYFLINGDKAYLKYGIVYSRLDFNHINDVYFRDTEGGYLSLRPNTYRNVTWADGDVYINKYGFRTKDFDIKKQPNTFRVIAMGESSTFGFHVSDNKTWPFLLGEKFNHKRIYGKRVEVINLGLPWYNTVNNLKLLDFALKLNPDLVIFYGAANDLGDLGWREFKKQNNSLITNFLSYIMDYSLFFHKADVAMKYYLAKFSIGFSIGGNYNAWDLAFSKEFENRVISDNAEKVFIAPFLKNVKQFSKTLEEHNVEFILVAQIRAPLGEDWLELQKNSGKFTKDLQMMERQLHTMNFQSYCNFLVDKMKTNHSLNNIEVIHYMHCRLRGRLQVFAKNNNITFLDFINYINGNFEYLKTDVHLTEEGNEKLASALHTQLTSHFQ